MQNIPESLGTRLAALMDAQGISVNALADKSGIARMTLTRRLRNPESLTLSEIGALAGVLGVKPHDLLVGPLKESA